MLLLTFEPETFLPGIMLPKIKLYCLANDPVVTIGRNLINCVQEAYLKGLICAFPEFLNKGRTLGSVFSDLPWRRFTRRCIQSKNLNRERFFLNNIAKNIFFAIACG
jgi:hypothetical protein